MQEPKLNDSLNKHDKVYHQLTYDLLTSPKFNFREASRTVIDTAGGFGNQVTIDLSDGSIPLSQTKPIGYKTQLFPEIVGFLRGETNLKWYLEQGMKIWTANAFNYYREKLSEDHPWRQFEKDTPAFEEAKQEYEALVRSGDDPAAGDLGNFYPKQWRGFKGVKESDGNTIEVDQIDNLIRGLQEDPTSRYHIVTAWNPVDVRLKQAALSPCHNMFQAYRYTDDDGIDRLDVKLYQRSADHLLGVAFNMPQYAALTTYIAAAIGAQPGEFIHSFGDIHAYVGQGERSEWYRNRENLIWLKEQVRTREPGEVLEDLLERLPSEGDNPGYDHMPFLLEQLSRESVGATPTIAVEPKSLEELKVEDLQVSGYDLKSRAKPLTIDGVRPKMAS